MDTGNITNALAYHALGWAVFPIKPKSKIPALKQLKKYQKERPDEDQIKRWWKASPDASIGVITGEISDLAVVDFDSTVGLEAFEARICHLPQTIISITGRSSGEGRQYFFRYPKDYALRNRGKLIRDVDVRGEGGYVVVPPSIHPSGKRYKWGAIDPIEFGLDDLCELPQEAIEFFQESKKKENREGWLEEVLWGVSEGNRNDKAAKYAGWLLGKFDGNKVLAWDALKAWNPRNRPPLEESELRKVLDSISSREGTNTFEHVTGIQIDRIEKLEYPDGEMEYRLNMKGLDKTIILMAEDMCSPTKFRVKLFKITDRLYGLPSGKKWENLINPLMEEAVVLSIPREETDMETLEEIISNDLGQGGKDPEHPEKSLNYLICQVNGVIYLKMSVLLKKIDRTSIKKATRRQLSSLLKKSGFEYSDKAIRFGDKIFKLWRRDNQEVE